MTMEPATAPAPDPATLGFDDALAELQRTVAELEAAGSRSSGRSRCGERGVALHERCAALLSSQLRAAAINWPAARSAVDVPGENRKQGSLLHHATIRYRITDRRS
jgi:exonuclease VII small subunit